MLIEGDTIVAIGSNLNERDTDGSTEVVDMTGNILSPGFINTHCHMWQTAFRTMAPDIYIAQYFPWLSQMGSAKESFTPHDIYISSLEGYLEGLNAGITSFVDHASTNWHPDVVLPSSEAAIDSGARVWWCFDINPYAGENFSIDAQTELLKQVQQNISTTDSQITMGLAFDGFDLSDDANVAHMKKVTHDIKAEALTTHYLGGPWPLAHNSPTLASTTITNLGKTHHLLALRLPHPIRPHRPPRFQQFLSVSPPRTKCTRATANPPRATPFPTRPWAQIQTGISQVICSSSLAYGFNRAGRTAIRKP